MSKSEVTQAAVARKNSLKLVKEETLRGTGLKGGTHPHMGDTGGVIVIYSQLNVVLV